MPLQKCGVWLVNRAALFSIENNNIDLARVFSNVAVTPALHHYSANIEVLKY